MKNGFVRFEYLDFNDAKLFTVVCLPDKKGEFPTVIIRSPYVDAEEFLNEEEICQNKLKGYKNWINSGYAVVFQHCRGRGKSTGDCIPFINERADGLFLQDWIRKQSFYNGELYLCGHSYTSTVHFVTAPFSDDIKGAVLQAQDCVRYNANYRNGFYKIGLTGEWYVGMYKAKSIREKNYTVEKYNILPLSDFSKSVFGETAEDFDEILKHPNKDDSFWKNRYDGETIKAINHANIPILFVTGFYDIYMGGVFDMWNSLNSDSKLKSALAVYPYDHCCDIANEPIEFENGNLYTEFENFEIKWLDSVRGKCEAPFERGKVTYYKLFDNKWCCDYFEESDNYRKFGLGKGSVTYRYDPNNPAKFKGGLSANFGGNAWQDPPNSRNDIVTFFTSEFTENVFVKGKMKAKLKVKTSCEDTCFYVRISLCKPQGDYGLRDDINQISNFCADYTPGKEILMDFTFDEHAFVINKGEKLRIDISSSALPFYVRHTNNKGLFSEQTFVEIADNTVVLDDSYIEIPID